MKNIIILMLLAWSQLSNAQPGRTVSIKIINTSDPLNDSTVVTKTQKYFPYIYKTLSSAIAKGPDHQYQYEVPGDEKFNYLSITTSATNFPSKWIFYDQISEPGDDITISVNNGELGFSGRGYEKYEFAYRIKAEEKQWYMGYLDSLKKNTPNMNKSPVYGDPAYDLSQPQTSRNQIKRFYSRLNFQLRMLKGYEGKISPFITAVIKENLVADMARTVHHFYHARYLSIPSSEISDDQALAVRKEMLTIFRQYLKEVLEGMNKDLLIYSSTFANLLTDCATQETSFGENVKDWILNSFDGEVRDRLLTQFFIRAFPKSTGAEALLSGLLKNMRTDYCIDILSNFYDTLRPGSIAYDFTLPDANGKQVSLKQYKGKTVVLDFWFTGCVGCLALAPHLKAIMEDLKNNPGIVFVSISIDQDSKLWKKSLESNAYSGEGAIELYTDGKGGGHPMISHYKIYSYPRLIVIDKNGKLISGNPLRPTDKSSRDAFVALLTK